MPSAALLPLAEAEVIAAPSPNHGERKGGAQADMVVVHYTAMESEAAALARLCDPAAEVSAHYLIGLNGRVSRLVEEDRRAWHAGAGGWGPATDVNSRSIGIELVNPGDGPAGHPFPEAQMTALERLLTAIRSRWRVPPERILGHSDTAPGRKIDPGLRFDWRRLAVCGLGVWLDPPLALGAALEPEGARALTAALARIGYRTQPDDSPQGALEAWRRRFWPAALGQPPSAACLALAAAMAERWPCAPD